VYPAAHPARLIFGIAGKTPRGKRSEVAALIFLSVLRNHAASFEAPRMCDIKCPHPVFR
jgi:hypothetical protein